MKRAWLSALGVVAGSIAACGGGGPGGDNAASADDGGAPPVGVQGGAASDGGGGPISGDDAAVNDSGGSPSDANGTDADVDAGPDAAPPPPTFYVYDLDGRLAGEYDAVGAPIAELAYLQGAPIAMMTPAATYTVYADHLATPRALADTSNHVVWRWDGDAFGTTPPDEDPDGDGAKVSMPLRFPGQIFDRETGLRYNMFRDYDPLVGRYVQPDPLGVHGGPNVYAYVNANPLGDSDRFGLARDLMESREQAEYKNATGSSINGSESAPSPPSPSPTPSNDPPSLKTPYDYCLTQSSKEACDNWFNKPKTPPPPKNESFWQWCKQFFGGFW